MDFAGANVLAGGRGPRQWATFAGVGACRAWSALLLRPLRLGQRSCLPMPPPYRLCRVDIEGGDRGWRLGRCGEPERPYLLRVRPWRRGGRCVGRRGPETLRRVAEVAAVAEKPRPCAKDGSSCGAAPGGMPSAIGRGRGLVLRRMLWCRQSCDHYAMACQRGTKYVSADIDLSCASLAFALP